MSRSKSNSESSSGGSEEALVKPAGTELSCKAGNVAATEADSGGANGTSGKADDKSGKADDKSGRADDKSGGANGVPGRADDNSEGAADNCGHSPAGSGQDAPPAARRRREAVGFWLKSVRALILLFLVLVTLVSGTLVGVSVYRTYFAMPEEIEVPVIQGKDLRTVNRLLNDVGLRLRLEEGKYSNKFPEQIVLSQQPAPGKTVRRDREVLAVVSLGPELMTVPDLNGKSEREAEILLAEHKLTLGKVSETTKEGVTTNAIVAQKPSAGTRVKRGSTVNVEVNRSEDRVSVVVPDWTGKNIAGATKLIAKAGLKMGRISWSPSIKVQQGFVISQNPPQGAEVAAGSDVDLEVSAGSEGSRMIVQRFLDIVLPQGSYAHDVRVVLISGAGQQEVYRANQVVGERLQLWVAGCPGSDIEIYVNDVVVKRDRL